MDTTETQTKQKQERAKSAILATFPPRYATLVPDTQLLATLRAHSVLISGPVGSGKTRKMLEVIYAYLLERLEGQAMYMDETTTLNKDMVKNQLVSVPLLLHKMRVDMDRIEGIDRIQNLIDRPLLFLDDLGTEKPSQWVLEQMYIILNERYMWGKSTMITTNLTMKEIAQIYGDRIASRLVEMCVMMTLDAKDYRFDNKPL